MSKQLRNIQILLKQHHIIYKLLFVKALLQVNVDDILIFHLSKPLRTITMQKSGAFYLLYSERKCSQNLQLYA